MGTPLNLCINGKSFSYRRIKIPLPSLDPLAWLEKQVIYPKVFWQTKGKSTCIASIGKILEFFEVPTFSTHVNDFRLFGSQAFAKTDSKKNDPLWQNFSKCSFFLPSFEIVQEEKDTYLAINVIDRNYVHLKDLSRVIFEKSPFKPEKKTNTCRSDSPSFEDWQKNVRNCLKKIENKELEKVVLARRTSFTFLESLCPYDILYGLKNLKARATFFSYQISPDEAFIGATPETLYRRDNDKIESEAVAGTRARGNSIQEDLVFKDELLNSEKEMREFLCVKDFMQKVLKPLCESLIIKKENEVITTPTVQHLYSSILGKLKSNTADFDLLTQLHPTPAIGGNPRDKALEYIAEVEPFDRGCYAAPIGWIGPNGADIAVAIRSALIQKNLLHLFAGTGIVEGSDAKKEWEELDQKIFQFQRVLQC